MRIDELISMESKTTKQFLMRVCAVGYYDFGYVELARSQRILGLGKRGD